MPINSRRKGHRWERDLVHVFAEVFGADKVRRGLQYRDGNECADVITPCLWVEAKRGRKTQPAKALEQAVNAMGNTKGLIPIAVCKDDQKDATVTLRLDDFIDLLKEWWQRGLDAPVSSPCGQGRSDVCCAIETPQICPKTRLD